MLMGRKANKSFISLNALSKHVTKCMERHRKNIDAIQPDTRQTFSKSTATSG